MQARLKDLSWKTQYSGIYTAPNRKTPQGPPSGVLARQTKRGAARHAQHSANAVRGNSFQFNSEPRPRKIARMLIGICSITQLCCRPSGTEQSARSDRPGGCNFPRALFCINCVISSDLRLIV